MSFNMKSCVAATLLCAGAAFAVPSLVVTGFVPTDCSPNGNFALGSFYNAATSQYTALRYTVGGTLFDTEIGRAHV